MVSQDCEHFSLHTTPPHSARQSPNGDIGLYMYSDRSMSTKKTSLVHRGLHLASGNRKRCLAAVAWSGAEHGLSAPMHGLEPWKLPSLSLTSDHAQIMRKNGETESEEC